jgi:hypothetical protein
VVSTRATPLPVEREVTGGGPDDLTSTSTGASTETGTGAGAVTPDRSAGHDPFEMAFPPGVAAKLRWYVYLLAEPAPGRPFYVGRGRGDRCFRHVQAARSGPPGPDVEVEGRDPGDHTDHRDHDDHLSKKFPVLEKIREVEATEGPVRLEILRYGLNADEARLVETAAADALGLQPDSKRGSRRVLATDLGTRLAKRAKFKRDHPVVLLRVGGKGADTAYGKVRHGWRIGRRWTDLRSSRSPKWAVIVAGDIAVGVYRIEGWEPTPLQVRKGQSGTPGTTTRSTYRHSFVGERDDELEQRYVGRSVAAYLGAGPRVGAGAGASAPNQVAYVWCGPHWANPLG